MVGLRDLTHSMKLRWWLSDLYSFTLYWSAGISRNQSILEASNPPRSTQTQPSLPIHLVPPRMSLWPPAIIMVTSFGYLQVTRYFVHVFQIASLAGNSPTPSTSSGP